MNLKTKLTLIVPAIAIVIIIIAFSLVSSDLVIQGEVERNNLFTPELELTLADGQQVNLSGLRSSPVLLNFWATWCQPCLDEMPSLATLEKRFGFGKLLLLAINIQESPRNELAEKLEGLTLPKNLIFNVKRSQISAYKLEGLPYSILLNKKGIPVKTYEGRQAWDSPQMIQELEELIQK